MRGVNVCLGEFRVAFLRCEPDRGAHAIAAEGSVSQTSQARLCFCFPGFACLLMSAKEAAFPRFEVDSVDFLAGRTISTKLVDLLGVQKACFPRFDGEI
jgi:hypothetical protein